MIAKNLPKTSAERFMVRSAANGNTHSESGRTRRLTGKVAIVTRAGSRGEGIGNCVLYLVSDETRGVTGIVLPN